jgi:hypothetical protein
MFQLAVHLAPESVLSLNEGLLAPESGASDRVVV